MKTALLASFEAQWQKLCAEYEQPPASKEQLQQVLGQLEGRLAELQQCLEECEAQQMKTEMQTMLNSIESTRVESRKQAQLVTSLEAEYQELQQLAQPQPNPTTKLPLKKKLENLHAAHKGQMQQFRWEIQQLQQGLTTTLKAEHELAAQLEKKLAVLDKLAGQLGELSPA